MAIVAKPGSGGTSPANALLYMRVELSLTFKANGISSSKSLSIVYV